MEKAVEDRMNNLDNLLNTIKIITICELTTKLFGDDYSKHPSYDEETKQITQWIKENNASYYADVKEDFSIVAAVSKAGKEGKTTVVVENLS